MKTRSIIYSLSAMVLACSLTLSSCKKKKESEEPEVDTEQASASDNSLMENTMSDIQAIAGEASETYTVNAYKLAENSAITGSCTNVTMDVPNKTYTVDFGTTPCLCKDGRSRSGKLIFNYMASTGGATAYRHPGFALSITSSNYVVDGYTVNISNKTIKNTTPATITTGPNPGTNLTWSITANVSISKPGNGGTVTWNVTRYKELLNTNDPNCYSGQAIPINWSKAKIQLNGSSSGVTASNDTYTATLTNLVRDMNCSTASGRHPFISGVLAFTPGTKATRTIDFGTGICDGFGTITINGNTYTFNIP
jgi:hypothetical protein